MTKKKFDYEEIDVGFYDHIYQKKEGVRSAWHHIKFNFVKFLFKFFLSWKH